MEKKKAVLFSWKAGRISSCCPSLDEHSLVDIPFNVFLFVFIGCL